MTIHLIRHGETRAPADRCVGHEDVGLSDEGRRSINQLADPRPDPPLDRLVSSDLVRARASSRILAEQWDVSVQTTDRLRELDFGRWTGRAWETIEAEEGKHLQAWMTDWVETAPPDGESFEALSDRVLGWLAETREETADDATIVVVAHAGPIRALLCHALDLPLDRAFRLQVDCASISTVATGRMGWTVVCLNSTRFGCPGGP